MPNAWHLTDLQALLNGNQGVLTVAIFITTLLFGWVSGIFAALRRKPRLRVNLIPGPSLCTTFPTGDKHNGYDTHRTAISLYLTVANVGAAPTSIEDIWVAYHWAVRPFSLIWIRYGLLWFWLRHQVAILEDFKAQIGDNFKVFPFLFQRSVLSGDKAGTYLLVGQSASGIVYFEQTESWGGFFPRPRQGQTKIKVAVRDAFGKQYTTVFWIPVVTLEEARKYNLSFGSTLETLHKGPTEEGHSP